jgi:hypothetical protein
VGGTAAHDGKILTPVSEKEVISTKSLSDLTVTATGLGGVPSGRTEDEQRIGELPTV